MRFGEILVTFGEILATFGVVFAGVSNRSRDAQILMGVLRISNVASQAKTTPDDSKIEEWDSLTPFG